jgi:hypothetical protein
MTQWAVIACDQHTSEPEYWERVKAIAADSPSAFNMMISELYFKDADIHERIGAVKQTMRDYRSSGVFRDLPESYIYVERTLFSGKVRKGIVGVLDLEQYDFSGGSGAPITGTEDIIPERLPLRVELRDSAPIDMPHVLAVTDLSFTVPEDNLRELLYDFELMEGGGSIKGWRIDSDCPAVPAPTRLLIGDGNHSVASAKIFWEKIKISLTDAERELHPCRFAMAELVSIRDPAIEFEPINRVVFDCVPEAMIEDIRANLRGEYTVCYAYEDHVGLINVPSLKALQVYLDRSCAPGTIDYIHGDDVAVRLARPPKRLAFIMAALDKDGFFENIRRFGSLPRKAFSMGGARDKRYYLECRTLL